jgi:hypothetical protein
MHYNREEMEARIAAREAFETVQMEALHEALGHLIAVRKLNLKPTNANLLWAEWHYAKAMRDLYSDDGTIELFQAACDNLGVGEDGLSDDERPENYGSSHPDSGRGFKL